MGTSCLQRRTRQSLADIMISFHWRGHGFQIPQIRADDNERLLAVRAFEPGRTIAIEPLRLAAGQA